MRSGVVPTSSCGIESGKIASRGCAATSASSVVASSVPSVATAAMGRAVRPSNLEGGTMRAW
jgi:hypothetical protein